MKDKSSRFFSLYTKVQSRLYAYILVMVHNRTAADDILQETAAIMWANFDRFQEGTSFSAWAIRIARNKALEFLRENEKTKKLFHDSFYEKLSHLAERSTTDVSRHLHALDGCLKKLNKFDRKLLHMRYQQNVPMKEISLKLGCPGSTLYHNISRIYGLLQNCILKTLANQEK